MTIDQRYMKVECEDCGRQYTCLPDDDYYKRRGASLRIEGDLCKGGVCSHCLRTQAGITAPLISLSNN